MALFYNTDGTISNVEINAIIYGKVTSSLATTPTIQQAFEASASNAAAQTANPTRTNRTNTGSLYVKSGATINRIEGTFVQYPWPTGSAPSGSPLYANGVLVSSSQQANSVLYGSGLSHYGNQNYFPTTASLVIKKITTADKAALGLPSVGAHALPVFYSSASWSEVGNTNGHISASIATGSILKLSVTRSYFEPRFVSESATKFTLVSSNINSNLNTYNTLSGSVSASVEYSHYVLFVSTSRALMGTLQSNGTYLSLPL
jgi:hypothetical protein